MGKPVGIQIGNFRRIAPAAASLVLCVVLVLAGGALVERPAAFDLPAEEDFFVREDPFASLEAQSAVSEGNANAPEGNFGSIDVFTPGTIGEPPDIPAPDSGSLVPGQSASSRIVEPAAVAPPDLPGTELERELPREPLSQLGLALPPAPAPVPERSSLWAGRPLFRPVAIESAVFQSGDHTIAIDGVSSIPVGESCVHEGRSWPCGVRARAAFRMWLRGRAVVCEASENPAPAEHALARCTLAKQDVGGWLVEHGWALAAPAGPYVEAGERARSEGRGIFGGPPDTSSLSDVADINGGTIPDSGPAIQPIMTEQGPDPQPSMEFGGAFPPAPPPP